MQSENALVSTRPHGVITGHLQNEDADAVETLTDTIVFDDVQAAFCADPNTASFHHHRGNVIVTQSIPCCERKNATVSKSVQAVVGAYPNVSFAIFQQRFDLPRRDIRIVAGTVGRGS